ncbi:MAG: undecaprenyl-diphosphatase, partial [Candidatus Aenigmarchaeota archaeon]|nr:undecaprenyl-diphosphatase [Candidatus Aenigmarchaeota archaeon]
AIIGVTISGIVGYFSLKLLMKFIKERKLKFFSWYCWILGTILIVIRVL